MLPTVIATAPYIFRSFQALVIRRCRWNFRCSCWQYLGSVTASSSSQPFHPLLAPTGQLDLINSIHARGVGTTPRPPSCFYIPQLYHFSHDRAIWRSLPVLVDSIHTFRDTHSSSKSFWVDDDGRNSEQCLQNWDGLSDCALRSRDDWKVYGAAMSAETVVLVVLELRRELVEVARKTLLRSSWIVVEGVGSYLSLYRSMTPNKVEFWRTPR